MAVVINTETKEDLLMITLKSTHPEGEEQSLPAPLGTTYIGVDSHHDIYAFDSEPYISCGFVHPEINHEMILIGSLEEKFLIKIPTIISVLSE